MPLSRSWHDVALRLAVALLAGVALGLNRGESGKPAGLCTTQLACLAACLLMLQMNALLTPAGKTAGSFVTPDMMRLSLGVLFGMEFIGVADRLRRSDGMRIDVRRAAKQRRR
ncbi:MgtC/SapB family protein [Mycetohabitans sp. B5]|uniref:Protein MgtC n=1 Tax=Mycetohabitans endofungorum TaxID=417203 RepID=A0A2P5KDI8_9BURK|nr:MULTISPECIES: MgtC/SapB family protein [Mycetohabitans]MCG1055867.1 MgtC/SapB family protein [Mycetohabitans sp. B5]PPB84777.1 MgtC family protein [Mycetohabitans endofungorum]